VRWRSSRRARLCAAVVKISTWHPHKAFAYNSRTHECWPPHG